MTLSQPNNINKADSPAQLNQNLFPIIDPFNNDTNTSPLSKDLVRALLSQISILITKLNKDNFNLTIKQIDSIFEKNKSIYPLYIKRLINQLSTEIVDHKNFTESNSTSLKVLIHIFNTLTLKHCEKAYYISQALLYPESQLALFSFDKFLSFFNFTDSQSLLILLSTEQFIFNNNLQNKYSSLLKDLQDNYIKFSKGLILSLNSLQKSLNDPNNNNKNTDILNFTYLLVLLLNSKIFAIPQKFIILSHISDICPKTNKPIDLDLLSHFNIKQTSSLTASKEEISKFNLYQTNIVPVNNQIDLFLESLQKMNFKQIILEFCDTKLSPEKLLADLMSIHPKDGINDSIILLLTETLLPGSQQQENENNSEEQKVLLTANNLPEATARGAKMLQIITKVQSNIDWNLVLNSILKSFDHNKHIITNISLSQFLSSIQTGKLIDKFLSIVCKSSDIHLLTQILTNINNLDPNSGAIDLLNSNLTPILSTETNSRQLLLYYKFIVMLEIKTVALLTFSKLSDNLVSQIFNKDIRAAPEYMILACLHLLHENLNAGENEIITNIMQNFFINLLDMNSPYLNAIFALFEEYDSTEFGKLLVKYLDLKRNPEAIHKIANLTATFKDDKIINLILDSGDDFQKKFSIAIVFSQYGWKHFNNFITKELENNSSIVLTTIIDYLSTQAQIDYDNAQRGKKINKTLDLQTVYLLMTTLTSEKLPKELFERSRSLQTLCLQAYPRLINFGQGHDSAILMNSATNTFSPDVEKEMKLYYQKMYKKEIEIKDIVHMLQRLKNSDNPHDQDVFACMIHSLLDEYRFFPEYPVEALATTSVLFGNTIVFKLVEGPALSISLRYILESAREPTQSKMFKFAIQALFSFIKRLPEFPKFCSMLCEIPDLKSQPELYEVCQNIANGKILPTNDPETENVNTLKNNIMEDDPELISKYHALSVPELSYNYAIQEIPPNEISDRILFMINNVSENNLDARTTEMKELLKPNHYKWFAKYLVNQRVKLELNNQGLYAAFVEKIDSNDFYTYVTIITIRSIILLLNLTYKTQNQENRDLSSTEKTHLKNLGSWLGRISLSNDHPILRKNFSFKFLLLEGYNQNTLDYIIPLICKILDQTKNSSIFKYPNPWLLGILQILKEIYEFASIRLNLKFEIEVLCNDLEINLKTIEPSNIIRITNFNELYSSVESEKLVYNMARMALNEKRGLPAIIPTPELSNNNNLLQQQQQQLSTIQQIQQIQQQRLLARNGVNSPAVSNGTPLAQQAGLINQQQNQQQGFNAFENLLGNTIFTSHPALKRIFQLSITKAVKDLLPPLVHRTNTVCLVTTKALIEKDFAYEVDDFKVRKAYINTVRFFAEHLILASSSDLVRDTIKNNLQQFLQHYMSTLKNPIDPSIAEQIPLAAHDNLQLALSIIQKAAVEKVVHDMDNAMLPHIALRRQFKVTSPNQPFCDTQNASEYAKSLPEPLGIQPGGVSAAQFSIYDEFGRDKLGLLGQMNNEGLDISGNNELSAEAKQRVLQQQLLLRQQQQQQMQQQQQQQQQQQPQQQPPQQQQQQQQAQQPQQPQQMNNAPIRLQNQGQNVVPVAVLEQTIVFVNQHIEAINKAIEGFEDKNVRLSDSITETETIKTLLVEIVHALSRVAQQELYMKYVQIFINLLFSMTEPSQLFIDSFIFLIGNICDVSSVVVRYVTIWLLTSDDERKYNKNILLTFITEGFISLSDLSYALAKNIESSKNPKIIAFACDLIKEFVFGPNPVALRSDFVDLIAVLENGDESIKENENVKELFDILISSTRDDAIIRLKNGLLKTGTVEEYMVYLFSEWIKLYKFSNDPKYQIAFISQMADSGILTKSDLFTQFFASALEVSTIAFSKETDNFKKSSIESYTSIDSLAKLVVTSLFIQKDSTSDNVTRIDFLNKFFSVFILTFANDHEVNKENFNERPYFRFFSTLFAELTTLRGKNYEPYASNEDEINVYNGLFVETYKKIADFLLCLQPPAFPGFTYAWMCLISHRLFMPVIIELSNENQVCGEKLTALLVKLLKFQSGYIEGNTIPESITVIYKGTIRIFLVLLHDYPEYLAQWYNPLVSATSMTFLQLRNMILSAVPFNMKFPDPFQQGLKVDRLPEISIPPIILSDPSQTLIKKHIKKNVDNYLRIPSNSLLRQILHVVELDEEVTECGNGFNKIKYDTELINSLVLYVGISYVDERAKNSLSFNAKSSQVTLLTSLMQEGDVELQFLILQAIANNLRYPNAHTHWFSCIVLHFFGSKTLWNDKREAVQQLISRVLLERIISHKPHPWGLLITFIELLKNKDYEFSSLPFTKITPEIENVLGALIKHASSTTSGSTVSPVTAPETYVSVK